MRPTSPTPNYLFYSITGLFLLSLFVYNLFLDDTLRTKIIHNLLLSDTVHTAHRPKVSQSYSTKTMVSAPVSVGANPLTCVVRSRMLLLGVE